MERDSARPGYLGKIRAALRLRGPLANDPTASILNALLIGILVWLVFDGIMILPFFNARKTVSGVLLLLVAGTTLSSLVLLHRGSLRLASHIFLTGVWLNATIVAGLNGGIRSLALTYYVALPISAAWLLGLRGSVAWAALCVGCSLAMALLEQAGLPLPQYFPGTPFGIWTLVMVAMIMASVPVARAFQILAQALASSRSSQEQLQAYQHHLEGLIAERTSELEEARDRAQRARDQALAANQAKSVFLANMSHELRTPLNAILGFSSLLSHKGISEEQRAELNMIRSSGEHLLTLINDVLDVAKIEAGKEELTIAPCDLISLVRETTGMMRERADAKGLALVCSQTPNYPKYVRADAPKLRQVLINLLGNAVKFTESGTVTVRLSATAVDAGRLRLRFEVEDTGIGISQEDQARIFEPFVQIGKPASQKGTGLGLTITRRFIEMMGGTIALESSPGHGSRFTVEVVVDSAHESEVPPAQPTRENLPALEPNQPDCRVLIVEDNPANAMMLEQMLSLAGFQIRTAASGALGVELFEQWRPHLIWMDLRMPEMSGAEAARRIRELDGGREVKIVAVTASAFESDRDEVLAAGMDDFIGKPYHPEEVFETMARHLGVRYRHDEATASAGAEPGVPLRTEALAALPVELRRELADAVISLNHERIFAAIDRVGERDTTLAAVLRRLGKRFAYTAIFEAIQRSELDAVHSTPGNWNDSESEW